jgi:hypothetical protein
MINEQLNILNSELNFHKKKINEIEFQILNIQENCIHNYELIYESDVDDIYKCSICNSIIRKLC